MKQDADFQTYPFFFRQVLKIASRIQFGSLTFSLPDGNSITFEGVEEKDAQGLIHVKDYSFARRTIFGGDIGFFESYADGQWDTPALADCLYIFARNAEHVQDAFKASPAVDFLQNIRRTWDKNTKSGSRRNIAAHYDLGNSFYKKWLDPTMTYSSAKFDSAPVGLSDAQINKYRSLATAIDLKAGEHVLEIGSGWGGFAEFAAKDIGARVTGLTLSPAQYEYARERIYNQGLNDLVEFKLLDYRDVDQSFDKIASIEMFEAVGKEYWQSYFEKVRNSLKPGGIAGLQIITIADRFFDRYVKSTDFIQRYIFPGGILPSDRILNGLVKKSGLTIRSSTAFGEDYARTLHEWRKRFLSAWDEISPLGFDERFNKLWRFYLAYCEAGFKAGTTNVSQIAAQRT
ncbi:cyclopropane-fatty-acyl-phospholipid synthase [Hyphococcus flavus]|uniref:Cyclopropane-fatty-acyl-phospholipid synthase n=1 Tax=Hyphococcus flavus TaxID=1866326 RepID=A0AAE9ZDM9_9PROT|nr:cyclopropane-fatty-acyl-phospholipid synthase family protein [Hyphococcus flavus]WDI31027.1 cyclopropane-fatty-acyl-phospholipid synthase [Hyphococcus flavus]